MTTLSSRHNPKIKQIRQLLSQRKEREETGLFVVEGIRHVGEAAAAHASLVYICYAPDLLSSDFARQLVHEQSQIGIPCFAVDEETFTSLAGKDNPQGILAVVRRPHQELNTLSPENFPRGVALVAPQDPGNIGTILRTIDATGASGLLLLNDPAQGQYSTDHYHPSAVRASMGSIFWYPMVSTTFDEFEEWVHLHGYYIYGTSAHASKDYRDVDPATQPFILLMGSEREGLSPRQSTVCDEMLRIPMRGRVTSLNLAVATGVMLFYFLGKLS